MGKWRALPLLLVALRFSRAADVKDSGEDEQSGIHSYHPRIRRASGSVGGCDIIFHDPKKTVLFFLYTKSNKLSPQQLWLDDVNALKQSHFDNRKKTCVLIHGLTDGYLSHMPQGLKNTLLEFEDDNVILVDWSAYDALLCYVSAIINDPKVGEYAADFITFLIGQGLPVDNLHLIGHSLGAHCVGFAGKKLKNVYKTEMPRITGLDPASPLYSVGEPEKRLDKADAKFVDCIHSDGGCKGFNEPICQADYYPNGGVSPQPGCGGIGRTCLCAIRNETLYNCDVFHKCAHSYSWKIFAKTINKANLFPAQQCKAVDKQGKGIDCKKSDAMMGYYALPKYKGSFYLTAGPMYESELPWWEWDSPFSFSLPPSDTQC